MPTDMKLKTFCLEDLIGRTIGIRSFRDDHIELIIATDIKSGEFFVLKQISHPTCDEKGCADE